jgi:hypothetical protein
MRQSPEAVIAYVPSLVGLTLGSLSLLELRSPTITNTARQGQVSLDLL